MRRLALPFLLIAVLPALAQEDIPAPVKFGDSEIIFARGEDEEVTVSYKGTELYRNYYVSFDRIVKLAGEDVALLSGGDGGNACGANSLIVTLPADAVDAKLEVIGDCGAPEPAVTLNEIYYVPYLMPGAVETLRSWSPSTGLIDVGKVAFAPKQGTNWSNFDAKAVDGPWGLFDNADVYAAGQALLKDKFAEVIIGLSVSGNPEIINGKFVAASGCAPHACGGQNGFFGIDLEKHQVYGASRIADTSETFWPSDLKTWPEPLQKAYAETKVE